MSKILPLVFGLTRRGGCWRRKLQILMTDCAFFKSWRMGADARIVSTDASRRSLLIVVVLTTVDMLTSIASAFGSRSSSLMTSLNSDSFAGAKASLTRLCRMPSTNILTSSFVFSIDRHVMSFGRTPSGRLFPWGPRNKADLGRTDHVDMSCNRPEMPCVVSTGRFSSLGATTSTKIMSWYGSH